jgi:hypothetical protein
MVPADDKHTGNTEADTNTSTKERKRRRLTPMPDCLMHWWTPLLLALILLAAGCFLASIWRMPLRPVPWWKINIYWPPSWPFNYHWPSKDAMALCATIAGAGFAFSAWQQKSHDNAVKEKEQARAQRELEADRQERERIRLEQIERDEYWKRREQIFQILASNNPGLRLGAVALLAELADTAAHSTLLNETEKQQLQRHIIDTLCLQLRHEGLALDNEGNISEHAEIQAAIFATILTRIDIRNNPSPYADWSREPINMTSCIVHTPLLIQNLTTHTTIDFSQSKFLSTFTLSNATITSLIWERAYFIGDLITRNNSTIGIRSLPSVAPYSRYINTTFMHDSETFAITLMSYENYKREPEIALFNCKFISKSTDNATPILIDTTPDESNDQKTVAQNLRMYQCQLADITIDATYINSHISIAENSITGHLQINLTEITNQDGIIERTPHASDRILIRNNIIRPDRNDEPIRITNYTDTEITSLLILNNNHISRPSDFNALHPLECKILTKDPNPFKFIERTPKGQITHTWQTGGGIEKLDTNFGPYLSSFFK